MSFRRHQIAPPATTHRRSVGRQLDYKIRFSWTARRYDLPLNIQESPKIDRTQKTASLVSRWCARAAASGKMKEISDEVSVFGDTSHGSAGVTGSRDKIGEKRGEKKMSVQNG